MIFRFNKAQLGPAMENALNELLTLYQSKQEDEIEVIADEFPYKLIVKTTGGVSNPIVWDEDKKSYGFVGVPVNEAPLPEAPAAVPAAVPSAETLAAARSDIAVNVIVQSFMALNPQQRTAFFAEVWNLIKKGA